MLFSEKQIPGGIATKVDRVVSRGHFFEVYLNRDDMKLRAFLSSDVPEAGSMGYSRVVKALLYKDGNLVKVIKT